MNASTDPPERPIDVFAVRRDEIGSAVGLIELTVALQVITVIWVQGEHRPAF